MSVRRALVDGVVLSLQDTCVLYPCCKDCFSRIEVEQQDKTRYESKQASKEVYRFVSSRMEKRYSRICSVVTVRNARHPVKVLMV